MNTLGKINLKELTISESISLSGGSQAELVGLGIASALFFPITGIVGMVWAHYNYFKD